MKNIIPSFWTWYHRHFTINVSIASFLFALQIFHLYWLFTDVVLFRLLGESYFLFDSLWGRFSIFFDYTEIPAIAAASLLYLHNLRSRRGLKNLFYLFLVNSQWLHILWITDEYVVAQFSDQSLFRWAGLLAWTAILIDFLELPVIYDTLKQALLAWREKITNKKAA